MGRLEISVRNLKRHSDGEGEVREIDVARWAFLVEADAAVDPFVVDAAAVASPAATLKTTMTTSRVLAR